MDHIVNTFDARSARADRAQADTSIEDLRMGELRYERAGTSEERLCLRQIDGVIFIARLIRAADDRTVVARQHIDHSSSSQTQGTPGNLDKCTTWPRAALTVGSGANSRAANPLQLTTRPLTSPSEVPVRRTGRAAPAP